MINAEQDLLVLSKHNQRLRLQLQPAYQERPERLQLSLHQGGHQISLPMVDEAANWLLRWLPGKLRL
jgi:predicted esterase